MIKHGMSNTSLHKRWRSIKDRCFNPNCKRYKDYGGRGIVMCEEWRNSFEAFRDWAFSNGYEEHLTIDRIDVNGNYEPSNCRWIPLKQQAMNKRNNHWLTINGETHTLMEWSIIKNIPFHRLKTRVKAGWDLNRLFEEKVQPQMVEFNGSEMTLPKLCKEMGISYTTVYSRIRKGQSLEEALSHKKAKK